MNWAIMKRPTFIVGEIAAVGGAVISAYLNNTAGVAFYGLIAATLPVLAYRTAKSGGRGGAAARSRMLQTLVTADVVILVVALLIFFTAADTADPALGWLAGSAPHP